MVNQKKSPKPTKSFGAKLKKFCKENYKSIILTAILFCFNICMIFFKLHGHGYSLLSRRALFVYSFLIIITALIIFILYKAKTNSWKIEKIFIVVAAILGPFYVLAIPVGGIPDEPAHFWRSYELSEGHLFPEINTGEETGIHIPDNLRATISYEYSVKDNGYLNTLNNINIQPSSNYVVEHIPAEDYAPFNYIPQVVGVWIGKIFHLSLILTFYLCRFLNLALCIFVFYLCVKYSPLLKKVIFLVAFFPMTMHLFASVSADGSIICAGTALITFVLYSQNNPHQKFNIKKFLLLLAICAVLTITKPVYAPLCLALFWLPKEQFSSNKRRILTILSLGILVITLLLIKVALTQSGQSKPGVDTSTQISFILSNPLAYLATFIKNAILAPEQFIDGVLGRQLEWFSVNLFAPPIITLFLFFAFLCAEQETHISRSFRLFTLGAFSSIVLLVFTALYISWTPPAASIIEGVQGRYFLPILLLIPLFCQPSKKVSKRSFRHQIVKNNYLFIFTALTSIYAITMVVCSHI